MQGPIRSVLLAAVAACAFGVVTSIGSASAATIEDEATAMLAIYGSPGSNGSSTPVGGGLGRNFGFGKSMLFRASTAGLSGESVSFTLANAAKTSAEIKDLELGGTLVSNKTGANDPLGFNIQFADPQFFVIGGAGASFYADTSDRPWIVEICSPASTTCKTDPQFTGPAGGVKIEDVAFNLGPDTVLQGTLWGVWENGAANVPPCIKLNLPPTGAGADQTLVETQGSEVGVKIGAIQGKACLVSANNDWYHVGESSKEPAVTIANT